VTERKANVLPQPILSLSTVGQGILTLVVPLGVLLLVVAWYVLLLRRSHPE
jgi:hypothetical protein